jgi:hypothetical protein
MLFTIILIPGNEGLMMKTIEVKVQDDLVALYGLEAIKNLIEEELAYQRFRLLENKIQRAMSETDIDWEKEFEQKREEAFEEYQRRRAGYSVNQTTENQETIPPHLKPGDGIVHHFQIPITFVI